MANEMTTRHADVIDADPTTWHQLWTAPFRAMRAVYWALDRDAKVRARGLQTVGQVIGTRTVEHTDSEGYTSHEHYVEYQFKAFGRTHAVEKQVGSLGSRSKGDSIRVYYLAENGRLDSALD